MSELHFRYAAMNAGKSTALLTLADGIEEMNLRIDARGQGLATAAAAWLEPNRRRTR